MRLTEELRREHEDILVALNILDRICKRIKSGQPFSGTDAAFVNELFAGYVDKCHTGKEENVLFPALEKLSVAGQDGHVAIRLLEYQMEHQRLAELVSDIDGLLTRIENEETTALANFVLCAREYIDLYRQHIVRENTDVFEIADEEIPQELHKEILGKFRKIEEDTIGVNKYMEFRTSLYALCSAAYPELNCRK